VEPGDDSWICVLVLATHGVRGFTISSVPPEVRGHREDRVRAAPAVSCAIDAQGSAHTSIQVQRKHSGLPCAMALRLIRALPGGHAVPPSPRRRNSTRLDASLGASGPHDFAVRELHHSPCDAAASIAPRAQRC
jgi:hypothetical protein